MLVQVKVGLVIGDNLLGFVMQAFERGFPALFQRAIVGPLRDLEADHHTGNDDGELDGDGEPVLLAQSTGEAGQDQESASALSGRSMRLRRTTMKKPREPR